VKHRPLIWLLLLATLFASGGASCPRMLQQYRVPPAPVVFEGQPSRERIIAVVNNNSDKINQLQTTGASLSVPGAPSLRASLSYEKTQRFRLIADTSITGVEVDMGSNNERFWMWVKRNDPPAVYFCRHDEFQTSGVREVMPIEPTWIAEALGVVRFDPAGQHEGPFLRGRGQVEIRSRIPTSDGEVRKVTVIDDTRGWVLEQHIYDASGREIATAIASQHRHDPTTGVTLPRHVEVNLPTIEMSFKLDVSDYIVNRLSGDPSTLWTMPQRSDVPPVDLGRQFARNNLQPTAPANSPQPTPYSGSYGNEALQLGTPQYGEPSSNSPRSFYDRPSR
jgi:hypothetical protein